ncbi:ComF family protein [Ktedonosporobacter rubrisoli]|uniref:ComF family protein n=1 Tax=Ktedonosporobacter rubrisoli TaxID=2509675 RepID=A0A4P6K1J7_KTERU|nr:ComF family protein [Ktedonosporobacter rubrisoli]QBD81949.1 ComF family protein [Ktedonosporobacter rubrisoli]
MGRETLLRRTQQIAQHMLDLLFPPTCAACKCGGALLCASCLSRIQPTRPPFCQHCHGRLSAAGLCYACQHHPLRLSGLRSASTYQDPLRACIHELKYNGNIRLAEPLGALLAQAYQAHGLHADLIVPIPLHHERERQRGYNQANLLAQVCSARLALPLLHTLVSRVQPTKAQTHLSASERQQNVLGAFLYTPLPSNFRLEGRKVLLIDDVCTTGATLEACAAPLFAAHAAEVWGLVLARPA